MNTGRIRKEIHEFARGYITADRMPIGVRSAVTVILKRFRFESARRLVVGRPTCSLGIHISAGFFAAIKLNIGAPHCAQRGETPAV